MIEIAAWVLVAFICYLVGFSSYRVMLENRLKDGLEPYLDDVGNVAWRRHTDEADAY